MENKKTSASQPLIKQNISRKIKGRHPAHRSRAPSDGRQDPTTHDCVHKTRNCLLPFFRQKNSRDKAFRTQTERERREPLNTIATHSSRRPEQQLPCRVRRNPHS